MNAKRIRIGTMAGILMLAVAGVGTVRADEVTVVTQQWSGATGGAEQPATRTLSTAAEWTAFWEARHRTPPAAFDPAVHLGVAVEIGRRRTGGWRVTILTAQPVDGRMVVRYRIDAPARGAMTIQMLTEPWAAAILPRTDLPVVFERAEPDGKPTGDAPPKRAER